MAFWRASARWLSGVALCLALGCPKRQPQTSAPPPPHRDTEALGVFHELKAGETLWGISRRYRVDVEEIMRVNGIDDPTDLAIGRVIFIPEASTDADAELTTSGAQPDPPADRSPAHARPEPMLLWPVAEGVLFSGYGMRQGLQHDGIDLGAPEGAPVLAAAAGDVIYVGFDAAYGNLVLIQHADGLITVYAHNRAAKVAIGQRVAAGEVIAEVGQSGQARGPHLHFEVRRGRTPIDPLPLLPEE